ncbi:hypothetical protein LEP1GSC018_0699 [Leptospira kirschneri str. 2008720114]|nr:hypothetical protein LEP1GSC018_0699 [Leptospira kirschneri str. 2008720114]EMJ85516.1 hypothetical protein LEP1GSC198_3618 [Leptospira kirschneri str. JB]EMK04239.1 hypothetical protein LEP1GSC166_3244 [Leptospira kirschneri]
MFEVIAISSKNFFLNLFFFANPNSLFWIQQYVVVPTFP